MPSPETHARPLAALALAALALAAAPGCEEQPRKTPPKTREILGKRTQDIRDTQAELKTGQANVADQKIIAKDPITLSGNAYVSAIGQISIGQIKHAVDLYHATNGEYPKTHEEFMEQIIRANNIALPTLPYYQEYAYNVQTHELQVLEYPARKLEQGIQP